MHMDFESTQAPQKKMSLKVLPKHVETQLGDKKPTSWGPRPVLWWMIDPMVSRFQFHPFQLEETFQKQSKTKNSISMWSQSRFLPFLESYGLHSEGRRADRGGGGVSNLRSALALRVHNNIQHLWRLIRLDHAVGRLGLRLRLLQCNGWQVDLLVFLFILS